jgi:hypothetical protein
VQLGAGRGTATYLQFLTARPTQSMISMALLHYGYLLFMPVTSCRGSTRPARFTTARRHRSGAEHPRLRSLGLPGYRRLRPEHREEPAHETAVKVSEGVSAVAGVGMGLPTALGAILGLVVLTVAMSRARWVSVVPAVLMLAGWALGSSDSGNIAPALSSSSSSL